MGYKAAMEDELCVWGLAWTFVVKSVLWSVCLFVIQWSGQIATFFWGGCSSNFCFENDWLFGVCVCVAGCEAFCTHICVSVVYRVFSSCVVVFLFVVIGSTSCQARILVGFCFFCGFLDVWRHVWVLIWCCLDRLRLSCVVYLSLCWKLHFGMLMCICYFRVRAASSRHGVRSFADVWCRPEESFWPNSCVVCCVLCVFKCFVFVPRVHRFPEHMVSIFISGLNDKPSHSARLRLSPREA